MLTLDGVLCVLCGVSREEGGQEGGARGGGDVFRPLRLILLSASMGGVEEMSGLFNTLFVSSRRWFIHARIWEMFEWLLIVASVVVCLEAPHLCVS